MFNSSFLPPSSEIKYNDDVVMTVRGLSLVDVSYLVSRHRADLEKVFSLYQSFSQADPSIADGAALSDATIISYGYELLREAPGILANIIAVGADARDQVENIARLPATIQIDALKAVCTLTIEDFGGLKPLVGRLMSFAAEVAPANLTQNG